LLVKYPANALVINVEQVRILLSLAQRTITLCEIILPIMIFYKLVSNISWVNSLYKDLPGKMVQKKKPQPENPKLWLG